MPNIQPVLNDIIRRISRREITANTKVTRRATVQYRHAIAALKKQVADLTKRLALVEKQAPKEITAPPEVLEKGRFRAMGVRAHRRILGLSAKHYGKLVGVSEVTIYKWESGQSYPQKAQKNRWLAIRGLGKREAMERLGMAEPKAAPAGAKPAAPKARKRGTFKQTAEEMILSLLKRRRMLTTSQLVAAWKKAGRGGKVDNVLSIMVAARKLKRKPLGGKMGSEYRAA